MLVVCDVPHSPKTEEEELKLVATLAIKGEDFGTPRWHGFWITHECFVVFDRKDINESDLIWRSKEKTWYKSRTCRIPTDGWDPEPILIAPKAVTTIIAEGPVALAQKLLGLKEHFR